MKRILLSRWTKVLLFLVCLIPLMNLLWRGFHADLGANPIEFITHKLGDWTIRFLLITLAVMPLRGVLNQPQLIRFRRMLGLFAFFYAFLHFMTWVWLDQFFDLSGMLKDVAKRPFITAGFTAFMLLTPLAVTSTAGWVRRLGYRRWQALHRLIYFSASAAVIHYYWLVKSDIRLPLLYGAILAILLVYRLIARWIARRRRAPVRPASASIARTVPS